MTSDDLISTRELRKKESKKDDGFCARRLEGALAQVAAAAERELEDELGSRVLEGARGHLENALLLLRQVAGRPLADACRDLLVEVEAELEARRPGGAPEPRSAPRSWAPPANGARADLSWRGDALTGAPNGGGPMTAGALPDRELDDVPTAPCNPEDDDPGA